MKKLLLIILSICVYNITIAQTETDNNSKENTSFLRKILVGKPWHEKYPGFAKTSGGMGMSVPIITNFKPSVWKGLEYRTKYFSFSYYTSLATYKCNSDIDTTTQVNSFALEYLQPLNFLRMGNRNNKGTKGWLLQPTLGVFYRTFKTTNKSSSLSLGISPEIQLQLPYSAIALKLNLGYNMAGIGSDLHKTTGFMFFPQLSFQFDALKDFHNTKLVVTGTDAYDIPTGSDGMYNYYKTVVSDHRIRVMDPFWAIGFRAETGTKHNPLPTYNLGAGFSGRWSTLMFDSYISYGKFFSNGFYDIEKIRRPADMTPFEGTVNNFGVNINVGADVLLATKRLFNPKGYKDMGFMTPYFSIYMGMGLSYLIPGETQFTNPTAALIALDSYFAANPDIERNAITDPSVTKSGMGMNFFIQFETASIGLILSASVQQKIGGSVSIGINYLFPLKEIK